MPMSINQSSEFNILGCSVRVKADDENNKKARKAIELLNHEVSALKTAKPGLKDVDIAVLSALNLATKFLDKDDEYRDNIFALRSGVEDALKFIEEVSSNPESLNP